MLNMAPETGTKRNILIPKLEAIMALYRCLCVFFQRTGGWLMGPIVMLNMGPIFQSPTDVTTKTISWVYPPPQDASSSPPG